jgi:hypothetical protein
MFSGNCLSILGFLVAIAALSVFGRWNIRRQQAQLFVLPTDAIVRSGARLPRQRKWSAQFQKGRMLRARTRLTSVRAES